jgi:ureidoglycolate lyase
LGTVLQHPGGVGRHYVDAAIEDMLPQTRLRFWINRLSAASQDIQLKQIERHPHSAQSFLPMAPRKWLTAVCQTGRLSRRPTRARAASSTDTMSARRF